MHQVHNKFCIPNSNLLMVAFEILCSLRLTVHAILHRLCQSSTEGVPRCIREQCTEHYEHMMRRYDIVRHWTEEIIVYIPYLFFFYFGMAKPVMHNIGQWYTHFAKISFGNFPRTYWWTVTVGCTLHEAEKNKICICEEETGNGFMFSFMQTQTLQSD